MQPQKYLPTEYATGADILPVVPVVVHSRDCNHHGEEQRHEDDAQLGDVPPPIEDGDLPSEVPRQETQTSE